MSDDERPGLGGRRRGLGGGWSDSSGDDLGGGKKRRQGQGEAQLLGVFATAGGKKKGGGKGKKAPSLGANAGNKITGFVKGETVAPTEIPRKQPKADDKSSDDGGDIDPRFKFDNAPNAPAPKEQGPQRQARNKLSTGQMSNTYGRGFAMMQKMGFTGGGLGRHNDGIANPIEVVKRKDRVGLQESGEKVGQDLFGTEIHEDRRSLEELLNGKAQKGAAAQASDGWKKDASGAAKRPRVEYKTASQIASERPSMRIIDMRGPEVKVASSLSELSQSLSNDNLSSLKEFRYNTRKLVQRYEDKIRSLADQRRYYEDVVLTCSAERERLEAAEALGPRGARSCRELAEGFDSLRQAQAAGELTFGELGTQVRKLLEEKPKEFQALEALDVALALAVPAACRSFASWQPLDKPEDGLRELASWVKLCAALPERASTSRRGGPSVSSAAGDAFLRRLCDVAVLPRLRAALVEWRVRDAEPGLRLVERFRATLSPEIADEVAMQLVLPRLRSEIDGWDPRADRTSPHLWVHPWLDVLGRRMEVLWAPIRFKLSACLDRWNPRDLSAIEMLRPWQSLFDPGNWEPLVEKVVMRLEKSIGDLDVRPDGQDVQPVKDLLAWVGIVPSEVLGRVLDVALFPHWHKALLDWLRAPGCDFAEVLRWYQGWKALLEALGKEGTVQRQLARGLSVMKQVMAGGAAAPAPEEPAYRRVPSAAASGGADEERVPAVATVGPEEVSLSLSDYLAEAAGEEGLIFRPKKALHNGKQVYQFGNASLYVERNLVYVAPKIGGQETHVWRPVSMDELLRLGRESTKPKGKR